MHGEPTLCALSRDVIQTIIWNVREIRHKPDPFGQHKPWAQLFPLSLVSKSLRYECLPHIFHEWSYTIRNLRGLLPENLWCHIRVLRIHDYGPFYEEEQDRYITLLGELWRAFPRMLAVATCIYTRRRGIRPDFADALITLPSLSALELVNASFPEFEDLRLGVVSGLVRLVFYADSRMRREHPISKYSGIEAYYLLTLMQGSNAMLQCINIPGASSPLVDMAKLQWPCLHTLILYEEAPHIPLIFFLHHTPSLVTLDVQINRRVDDPHYVIYPGELSPEINVPRLRSLTFTNPSPEDNMLRLLSDARFLSFGVLPAAYSIAEGVNLLYAPIWNAKEAAGILAYNEIPNLVELRISVQGEGFIDLVKCISRAFPLLETLELHHYPTEEPRLILPFELPFVYLAPLCRLTELRLDLNIMAIGAFPVEQPTNDYFAGEEKRAVYVAENLPQLNIVGMLYRFLYPDIGVSAFWNIYNVSRNDHGVHVEREIGCWDIYPFEA